MKIVQPIRDLDKIEKMKKVLKNQNYRDYVLFVFGIQTGLRISDILELRVKDVKNKSHIPLKETKTKKNRRVKLNSYLREIIDDFVSDRDNDEYLFKSRKGFNKPINRQRAYAILNDAAKRCGIEEIGTHTLRKTMGYHFYQKTKDVALLQGLFNHSAPSVTLRYIGITQDMEDDALEDFVL